MKRREEKKKRRRKKKLQKKVEKRNFQEKTQRISLSQLSTSLLSYSPSESSNFTWSHTLASVLAAIMPLAAAAGTPIPGAQLSPTRSKPGKFVLGPGNVESDAEIPGP